MAKKYTSADIYKALIESKKSDVVICDGDQVKLNVKKIQKHPDYKRLNPRYKQFVEENADKIFTASVGDENGSIPNTVGLKESEDTWLCWVGDIIKVN